MKKNPNKKKSFYKIYYRISTSTRLSDKILINVMLRHGLFCLYW